MTASRSAHIERAAYGNIVRDVKNRVRILEALVPVAGFELKVTADVQTLTTGSAVMVMMVPEDVDGYGLISVAAGVSTPDTTSDIEIMIRNVTTNFYLLSTPITIEQGENTSYTAAVQPVIEPTTTEVSTGDMIAVDVNDAGTDGMGLMVVLDFG